MEGGKTWVGPQTDAYVYALSRTRELPPFALTFLATFKPDTRCLHEEVRLFLHLHVPVFKNSDITRDGVESPLPLPDTRVRL